MMFFAVKFELCTRTPHQLANYYNIQRAQARAEDFKRGVERAFVLSRLRRDRVQWKGCALSQDKKILKIDPLRSIF